MKKFTLLFILIFIGCVGFSTACTHSVSEPNTLSIKNELTAEQVDQIDIGNAAIAPMYLPEASDGKKVNLSYHKTGLSAAILSDQTTLASFTFSRNENDESDSDYPSTVSDAFEYEDDSKITVHYRISELWVCEITSDKLSRQELEKVLNSLTFRENP